MSEEVEAPKTLNIDGHEYKMEDLSNEAIYYVSQMSKIRSDMDETRRLLDRQQMSHNGFAEGLKKDMGDLLKPMIEPTQELSGELMDE